MGNSSLGSDGGSDARGRAYSRGCRLKDVGHQSKAFRQPSRPIPASGKHCYARHATCTLREATRILPHRPSFSSCLTWHQLDRSPTLIGCNHYANWCPISLVFFCRVCFLSSFLSSCHWWLRHLGESTRCKCLDSAICRRLCTQLAELSRSQKTLWLVATGYPTFPASPFHLAFSALISCQPLFCT